MTAADVRSRFPGLSDGWVRLDGPAGTLPVDTCIDAIADYMRSPAPANLGGSFEASRASDAVVDRARQTVGRLVGAQPDEIVFGPSTTNLMFAVTRALSRSWEPGDRIVCTQLDHDSNVSPWLLAARDVGATVEMLEVDPVDGTLDVEPLKGLCADGRTRWVAISGASNLTGHAPDLARAAAIAHEHGARILVDGVARVPHLPTDAAALDLDVLSTSPYKWYGPHAGITWVRPELLDQLKAYKVRPAPSAGPGKFMLGTPAYENIASLGAAARFLMEIGMENVRAHERALFSRLLDGLLADDRITVLGPHDLDNRAPTLAFNVADIHPADLARRLAVERIAVWDGNYYAVELMERYGLPDGAVRAGIALYVTDDDVDRLLDAVRHL